MAPEIVIISLPHKRQKTPYPVEGYWEVFRKDKNNISNFFISFNGSMKETQIFRIVIFIFFQILFSFILVTTVGYAGKSFDAMPRFCVAVLETLKKAWEPI